MCFPFQVLVPKEELSLDVIKQYRVVVNSEEEKYKVLRVRNVQVMQLDTCAHGTDMKTVDFS